MKLLLYCTKAKPYLQVNRCVLPTEYDRYILSKEQYYSAFGEPLDKLNGKIVGECDFEVEEVKQSSGLYLDAEYITNSLREKEILKYSCLTNEEMENYLKENKGYAIHIKNLHIFDKPKELSEYKRKDEFMGGKQVFWETIKKAPQNMCYAYDNDGNKYIVISIQPQWLCKILNGEKTIEVRKKVLKGMLENV